MAAISPRSRSFEVKFADNAPLPLEKSLPSFDVKWPPFRGILSIWAKISYRTPGPPKICVCKISWSTDHRDLCQIEGARSGTKISVHTLDPNAAASSNQSKTYSSHTCHVGPNYTWVASYLEIFLTFMPNLVGIPRTYDCGIAASINISCKNLPIFFMAPDISRIHQKTFSMTPTHQINEVNSDLCTKLKLDNYL